VLVLKPNIDLEK